MDNPMHGDKISPCIGSTISKKFFVFIWDGLERVREALPEGGSATSELFQNNSIFSVARCYRSDVVPD